MNASNGPNLIDAYTRADALTDGNLVDVSAIAKEAGFKIPVAVTHAVWGDCVAWEDEDTRRTGYPQDESGRLWDVVWMTRYAIARQGNDGDRVDVVLDRVPRSTAPSCEPSGPQRVELVAVIGPGDQGEPVITIMQPQED